MSIAAQGLGESAEECREELLASEDMADATDECPVAGLEWNARRETWIQLTPNCHHACFRVQHNNTCEVNWKISCYSNKLPENYEIKRHWCTRVILNIFSHAKFKSTFQSPLLILCMCEAYHWQHKKGVSQDASALCACKDLLLSRPLLCGLRQTLLLPKPNDYLDVKKRESPTQQITGRRKMCRQSSEELGCDHKSDCIPVPLRCRPRTGRRRSLSINIVTWKAATNGKDQVPQERREKQKR